MSFHDEGRGIHEGLGRKVGNGFLCVTGTTNINTCNKDRGATPTILMNSAISISTLLVETMNDPIIFGEVLDPWMQFM